MPQDLKIVGHDNLELIDYFYPKLTTIKENFEVITLEALKHLINMIEGKEEEKIQSVFESIIIKRETV